MYQKKNFFNAAEALSGIIKQTPLLWSKKLNETLKSWKFDYEEKKSLTNPESMVIKISNLKKRNG